MKNLYVRNIATQSRPASDCIQISAIGVFNATIPDGPKQLEDGHAAVDQLKAHLLQSLKYRVQDVPMLPSGSVAKPRVAVLFSGGLDCTVLARLTHELVSKEQQIDLLNVAFENPRLAAQNKGLDIAKLYEMCPDRITGRQSFTELTTSCPGRRWNFVAVG